MIARSVNNGKIDTNGDINRISVTADEIFDWIGENFIVNLIESECDIVHKTVQIVRIENVISVTVVFKGA